MIFDINEIQRICGKIKGAIHVGAYDGAELNVYRSIGLYNSILFEPQKKMFDIITNKLHFTERAFNFGLGDEDLELEMYISSTDGHEIGTQSSSFLKPKIHLTEHTNVHFLSKEVCKITTLNNIFSRECINPISYNFLNIDVQGYELKVLKGATNILPYIDTINLEVNRDEVYENCALIENIESFLFPLGFKNIITHWQSKSWGDAIYAKYAQGN